MFPHVCVDEGGQNKESAATLASCLRLSVRKDVAKTRLMVSVTHEPATRTSPLYNPVIRTSASVIQAFINPVLLHRSGLVVM